MESSKRGRKPLTPWTNPTDRYNNDPEYREHRKRLIREHARKTRGLTSRDHDASVNLNRINEFASIKDIVSGVDCEKLRCLNCTELGEVLGGYTRDSIYKWQRAGFLPKPIIEVLSPTGRVEGAYTVAEVEAIMPIIIVMQSKLKQLKDDNGKYAERMQEAIESVRR